MCHILPNEVFAHFLEFGLLDGLGIPYDGSPRCFSMIAMLRGRANTEVKAKD